MGILHPDNLCKEGNPRVTNQESLLRDDDHALATHTKRRKGKDHFKKEIQNGSHPPNKFQKNRKGEYKKIYFSSYQCYNCDKIGHIAKNCPTKKEEYKSKNNKRHHANLVEEEEHPPRKL